MCSSSANSSSLQNELTYGHHMANINRVFYIYKDCYDKRGGIQVVYNSAHLNQVVSYIVSTTDPDGVRHEPLIKDMLNQYISLVVNNKNSTAIDDKTVLLKNFIMSGGKDESSASQIMIAVLDNQPGFSLEQPTWRDFFEIMANHYKNVYAFKMLAKFYNNKDMNLANKYTILANQTNAAIIRSANSL